jgi:prevent-host-death family protein
MHMTVHTYSSREFTRDVGAAKRAAARGPVVITDRGRPAFALLKIEDYYELAGKREASLLAVMDAIPGGDGINFDTQKIRVAFPGTDFT